MADRDPKFRPLQFTKYTEPEMLQRADQYRSEMSKRRSVREFSSESVPTSVIESCILTAGSAPSGANRQPWHFSVVYRQQVKRQIRLAAEEEERAFYQHRAPDDWLAALAPLGTDADKPFLEHAPVLIVIFAEKYGVDAKGNKLKNYYVPESVGIATGMLIGALHHAGLATLTHTPSPMKFLNRILDRPEREKPTMILVVGYPQPGTEVPNIQRKTLLEIASFTD
ncbi:MAG: nitroreductase family protein [Pseudomonadota bacterium]